ncbi:hypothetical protein HDA32_003404 [Spinactinospora alkalitolerans]|uniref:Uncharacterized protein n=1 Tax=Spinactinospora alkalitolerans TaxID=687207 RepID=A0A852U2B1_9ACTN|nr:hypothetical protein [Spinactinospora alkalitolerans]NYE48284.1 hypothetical protein [Spinactinospora alkalitolerans]
MTTPAHPVPRSEIAATLQTSRELGPDYDDAVAASLAERLDHVIDTRIRERVAEEVDARLAEDGGRRGRSGNTAAIGVTAFFSLLFGAPATGYLAETAGVAGAALLWLGIAAVNVVVLVASRRSKARTGTRSGIPLNHP